jgi:3'-5' exoribonuclease
MPKKEPEHVSVSALKPGPLAGVYQVRDPKIRQTQKGDDYLALSLADRTGVVSAKMWQATRETAESAAAGGFVEIEGVVELYKNKPQVVIRSLVAVKLDEASAAEYVESADLDPVEVAGKVFALLDSMADPWLRQLGAAYRADVGFMDRLGVWPAAKAHHHPYRHGLIEHVLSVMELGDAMARHYGWLDRDLVLLGLFLHDSGKLVELVAEPSPGYSVEGQLLGHITIGIVMLDQMAARVEGFPPHRLVQLKHIILSHHESAEYGSPKPPMFAEAQVVHTIEMLDAKMNAFMREGRAAAEMTDETGTLRWSRLLDRHLYQPPVVAAGGAAGAAGAAAAQVPAAAAGGGKARG